MKRPTLGDILWRVTLKVLRAIGVFFKHRPSLAVSLALHVGLLVLLGYCITLSAPQNAPRYFSPAIDEMRVLDETEPLLPVIDDADGDTHEAADRGVEPVLLDATTQFNSLSNIVAVAGINTPAILPFGAGDGSVQGIGGTRSGTGRTIKNKGMGKLFGLEVGNAGLVVLLDNSDSMKTVAAQVRKLVEREFPTALCMELSGALFCDEKNLDKLGRSKKIGEPLLGYYRSGLAKSVISLTVNHLQTCQTAPESVYMMSDFEDYVDFPSVNEFGALLAEKKVKFFAHSVGQRPPSAITRLCQQTGGAVLLLPPEKLPEVTDEKE